MSFIHLLKQADIFFELTPNQMELIGALCEERHCNSNDVIFEENAPSDELYLIAQGEVEIHVDHSLVTNQTTSTVSPVTIATLPRRPGETLSPSLPRRGLGRGLRASRWLAPGVAPGVKGGDPGSTVAGRRGCQ